MQGAPRTEKEAHTNGGICIKPLPFPFPSHHALKTSAVLDRIRLCGLWAARDRPGLGAPAQQECGRGPVWLRQSSVTLRPGAGAREPAGLWETTSHSCLCSPQHLEGYPPEVPHLQALREGGWGGSPTSGQRGRKGGDRVSTSALMATQQSVMGARSEIRMGSFLAPRYTAKPQTLAVSWRSCFHIPLTEIHPSLSLEIL